MMLVDHWAHRHADDPKLKDEVVATGLEEDLAELEAETAALEAAQAARAAAAVPESDWEDV